MPNHSARPEPFITSMRRGLLGIAGCVLLSTLLVAWNIDAPAHADDPPPQDMAQSDDLDGDDVADTVTAAPAGDGLSDPGFVRITSGADGLLVSKIEGRRSGDRFGEAIATSWDVSGDGFNDLLVGAPKDGLGMLYVFDGPFDPQFDALLSADDRSLEICGPDADIFEFGFFVKGLPDADDDGIQDILTQGRFVDADGNLRIRTYVLSGVDGQLIHSMNDAQPSELDGGGGGMAMAGGVPPCSGCEGDITDSTGGGPDGFVDVFDLLAVLDAQGLCPDPCPPYCPEDITNAAGDGRDCAVDVFDLLMVLDQWGACDSDGDGIPDYWEMHYSNADVCVADANNDPDEDGLSNLEEFNWGTDPGDPDDDDDGVLDGAEVIAGADPTEPADHGIGPNSENLLYVMLNFGDHSCHNSETWLMQFGDRLYSLPGSVEANCQEPGPDPCANFECEGWNCEHNVPEDVGPIPIERGQVYRIQMLWLRTAYPLCDGPDANDWTCLIDLCDANGGNRRQLMEFFQNDPTTFEDDEWLPKDPIDGVFIDDPAMIMGKIWNHAAPGGAAFLESVSVGLDVDSTNDGAINAADDEIEDESPGKLVMANDDDDDFNSVADHAQPGPNPDENDLVELSTTAPDDFTVNNWTLEYNGQVTVWSDAFRTTLIPSGAAQSPPLPKTLYVEAVAPSAASGDISVKLNVELERDGATFLSSDTVRLTAIGLWFVGRDFEVDVDGNGLPENAADANAIIPPDEALNVVNSRPGSGNGSADFESAGADDDLFRIQVQNAARDGSVAVGVQVLRNGQVVDDSGLDSLTKVSSINPAIVRGRMNRLVTDTVDAGSASWRHLVELGDVVRLYYSPRYRDGAGQWVDAPTITREIMVGRPSSEENNNPQNQRKHDVRILKIRTHVFDLPNGNPSATPQEVQDDVEVLRERMAQATIAVQWDGVIHSLDLPADGSLDNGLTVSQIPFQYFNAGETHIVNENAIDDVLDVFYVEGVTYSGQPGAGPKHAVAYIKSANVTGIPAGHNFIVMNTEEVGVPPNPPRPSGPFTLGHEVMHILLDTGHRADPLPLPWDPGSALFHENAAAEQSITIGGPKRIGPNADTIPASVAGDDDTFTIRDHAEVLP